MSIEINSMLDLRNLAVDSDDYTEDQIKEVLINSLRKKAYRRGLKAGLVWGALFGCLMTWVLI